MSTTTTGYAPKTFTHLKGLTGISDAQLEEHFKLYAGYVNNTNTLNQKVEELTKAGKSGTPEYGELKRRYGFEYCGMVLHEYYFDNMTPGGMAVKEDSKLYKKITECFGDWATFETDFKNVGKMRGIGWAILFQDPTTKKLSNHFVADHEIGNIPGYKPILVMDVWEHAYIGDYKATERGKYIDSFFQNICWKTAGSRVME
jgi:Fe-Mn family superoxide dismutase